jgi:hypothetical protein
LKIDAAGNVVWNRTYGGQQSEMAYAIAKAVNGYVMVGDTRSTGAGESDAWVIKVDLNGNLTWEKAVGGEGFDMPTCITVSSDEGFLIGGFTFSFGSGERDFWLFKIDDDGNSLWSCTAGKSEFEEAYAVIEVAENDFVMAGWTNSIGQGSYDYDIVRINVELGSLWLLSNQFFVFALVVALVCVFLVILLLVIRKRSKRNAPMFRGTQLGTFT